MSPILATTLTIDIVGILVGIVSIGVLLKTRSSLGGIVGGGIKPLIWGVLCMILAFLWTIIFTRLKLLPAPTIDIHHALMTAGMILFVISARSFAKASNI